MDRRLAVDGPAPGRDRGAANQGEPSRAVLALVSAPGPAPVERSRRREPRPRARRAKCPGCRVLGSGPELTRCPKESEETAVRGRRPDPFVRRVAGPVRGGRRARCPRCRRRAVVPSWRGAPRRRGNPCAKFPRSSWPWARWRRSVESLTVVGGRCRAKSPRCEGFHRGSGCDEAERSEH